MNAKPQLSTAYSDLLAATRRVLSDRRAARHGDTETQAFNVETQTCSKSLDHEVRRRLLAGAGIDEKLVERDQQIHRQRAEAFIRGQEERALATASAVSERQASAHDEQSARFARMIQFGEPPFVVADLQLADSIEISPPASAQGANTSIAPGSNLAHIRAHAAQRSYLPEPFQSGFASISWHFLWTPPRVGLLNAVGFVFFNGFEFHHTDPILFVGGFAKSLVQVQLSISQITLQGTSADFAPLLTIYDDQITDHGWSLFGETHTHRFDEVTTLGYQNQFIALPDLPVDLVVEVTLWPTAGNGVSNLDFLTAGYSINVPNVYAMLS